MRTTIKVGKNPGTRSCQRSNYAQATKKRNMLRCVLELLGQLATFALRCVLEDSSSTLSGVRNPGASNCPSKSPVFVWSDPRFATVAWQS
ncbi:hypothetical protein Mp_4g08450 [Marchantia polymorpha subsp. ruderalis]|uniref:Uncharacterized protein n=2 Tax=Marchantia polymorpha TaxID=3197 RepID=A0AAF6B7S1_MARPO|nr:hypothetical protein MARPO_0120s0001 [Marchantia polymorpha]BBN08055.1 hypothetical protein Mp_4g08450 [Marchantia polymorpha subsp. ruderalis]|eukprot:PTQ30716.1 hypothetical protein MARPO_0120s0001 [Marchantia polymorpha]